MIFHPFEAIFLHPGKTAGTAVEYAFGYTHETNPPYEVDYGVFKGYCRDQHLFLQHASAAFMAATVPKAVWLDYFKLVSVRNPFERMISVYYFLHDRHRHWWGDFGGFIAQLPKLVADERMLRGSHYIPQSAYATVNGDLVVDRVLRFESIEDDLGALALERGWGPIGLARVNTATSPERPEKPAAEIYDSTSKAIVQDLYCEDFERFGYNPEPPTSSGSHP